jgi:hypothetical protein
VITLVGTPITRRNSFLVDGHCHPTIKHVVFAFKKITRKQVKEREGKGGGERSGI